MQADLSLRWALVPTCTFSWTLTQVELLYPILTGKSSINGYFDTKQCKPRWDECSIWSRSALFAKIKSILEINRISFSNAKLYSQGLITLVEKYFLLSEYTYNLNGVNLSLHLCLIWFFTPQSTFFSVMSGRVFLGWASTKQGQMCPAQGHNTVRPVRLQPTAPCSRVKNSTTESLCSHLFIYYWKWSQQATCKCLCQGLISAYRQTLWAQIRQLLQEQSDLGPPVCYRRFKMDQQTLFSHD